MQDWTTPLGHPFYPPLPAEYRRVTLQYLFFRARPDAVQSWLPSPLRAAADGACAAVGVQVPWCSHYGCFEEAIVMEKCHFADQCGWYCSHVPHNGPAGIAAGREIYGTAKFFCDFEINAGATQVDTTVRLDGQPLLILKTHAETACPATALPSLAPSWRLKLIPRADRPAPAIKQLIDGAVAAQDSIVHSCARGTGTIDFPPHPRCDLSALNAIEITAAFHLETSFKEGYAEIVHDYLSAQI